MPTTAPLAPGPFERLRSERIRRKTRAEDLPLQEPTIDPVFLAAGGIAGGLDNLAAEEARKFAVEKYLGSSMPFWDSPIDMFREIPYSPIKHFLQGFGDDFRGGLFSQLLASKIAPSHPLAGKYGALPAGQYPTGVFSRMLDFARSKAGELSKLPE